MARAARFGRRLPLRGFRSLKRDRSEGRVDIDGGPPDDGRPVIAARRREAEAGGRWQSRLLEGRLRHGDHRIQLSHGSNRTRNFNLNHGVELCLFALHRDVAANATKTAGHGCAELRRRLGNSAHGRGPLALALALGDKSLVGVLRRFRREPQRRLPTSEKALRIGVASFLLATSAANRVALQERT